MISIQKLSKDYFSRTGIMTLPVTIRKQVANATYLASVRKPVVAARYIRKYLRSLLTGTVTPRQIDIALTYDCNLKCSHCFATPLNNPSETEMSYDTLKQLAAQCLDLDITVFHFTGGEILLREDLEEVIRLFHPDKNIIHIQSNGTLASYDRLVSLKKAGLDFFGTSLEASDKTEQDKFRRHNGYYDSVMTSLDHAKKAGLLTSVNITIDNTLIHSSRLPELIRQLDDDGHIVYGNLPVPVGRFKHSREKLWFGDERKRLNELTRKFPGFRTEFDSNFGKQGCPAMKEKIYVSAYGDVLPCPYIHVSFGNVKAESLKSIYNRCMSFDIFKHYHNHCIAAENCQFIDTVIEKTNDYQEHPVSCNEVETELREAGKLCSSGGQEPTAELSLLQETVLCEVCGSKANKPVVTAQDYETDYSNLFSVVQCRRCGLVYTSPRPSMKELFDFFYDSNYVCYRSTGVADKIREEYLCKSRFRELNLLLPDGGRFLDVGCSYGYFLDYLQTNTDWEAFGCEPNTGMAELASERGLNVTAATLSEASYPSDSFDMVYMSHVLEHVPDLKKTVCEVFRILKPGGLFVTENPDFDAPTRELFGKSWWGYHLPRHLTHLTKESMTRLLTDNGLMVEHIRPCFRPGPIAWSFSNVLKERKAPELLTRLFGIQNPMFVAAMGIPALIHLSKGHTDMMETVARKPVSSGGIRP